MNKEMKPDPRPVPPIPKVEAEPIAVGGLFVVPVTAAMVVILLLLFVENPLW